jgi:prevent-host-death family protein
MGAPDSWQLQEAKAKLSELIRRVELTPQEITLHGKAAAFLVTPAQFAKLQTLEAAATTTQTLLDVLQCDALADIDFDALRDKTPLPTSSIFDHSDFDQAVRNVPDAPA